MDDDFQEYMDTVGVLQFGGTKPYGYVDESGIPRTTTDSLEVTIHLANRGNRIAAGELLRLFETGVEANDLEPRILRYVAAGFALHRQERISLDRVFSVEPPKHDIGGRPRAVDPETVAIFMELLKRFGIGIERSSVLIKNTFGLSRPTIQRARKEYVRREETRRFRSTPKEKYALRRLILEAKRFGYHREIFNPEKNVLDQWPLELVDLLNDASKPT